MEKRACVVALHTGSWGLRVLSCVRWESPGAFFSPIGSREKLRSHRPPFTKGNGVVSGTLLDSQARRRRASARPIFALAPLLPYPFLRLPAPFSCVCSLQRAENGENAVEDGETAVENGENALANGQNALANGQNALANSENALADDQNALANDQTCTLFDSALPLSTSLSNFQPM